MNYPLDHYTKDCPFAEEWLFEEDRKKHDSYKRLVRCVYTIDWQKLYKVWKAENLSFKRLAEMTGTGVSSDWVRQKLHKMREKEG